MCYMLVISLFFEMKEKLLKFNPLVPQLNAWCDVQETVI
jgi:hypothetical protein